MGDKRFSASWPVRAAFIALPMAVLTWLGVVSRCGHPFLVGQDLPWIWPRALFFAPVSLLLRRG